MIVLSILKVFAYMSMAVAVLAVIIGAGAWLATLLRRIIYDRFPHYANVISTVVFALSILLALSTVIVVSAPPSAFQ